VRVDPKLQARGALRDILAALEKSRLYIVAKVLGDVRNPELQQQQDHQQNQERAHPPSSLAEG
jgi:hypothetical protein